MGFNTSDGPVLRLGNGAFSTDWISDPEFPGRLIARPSAADYRRLGLIDETLLRIYADDPLLFRHVTEGTAEVPGMTSPILELAARAAILGEPGLLSQLFAADDEEPKGRIQLDDFTTSAVFAMSSSLNRHPHAGPMVRELGKLSQQAHDFGDLEITTTADIVGVMSGVDTIARLRVVPSLDRFDELAKSGRWAFELEAQRRAANIGPDSFQYIIAVESFAPYRTGVFSFSVAAQKRASLRVVNAVRALRMSLQNEEFPPAYQEPRVSYEGGAA